MIVNPMHCSQNAVVAKLFDFLRQSMKDETQVGEMEVVM